MQFSTRKRLILNVSLLLKLHNFFSYIRPDSSKQRYEKSSHSVAAPDIKVLVGEVV